MRIIQKLSSTILSKTPEFLLLLSILAVFGTILELTGGIWDAVSHIMREPEFFWTIQHVSVYTGVAMISSSGILGGILLAKKTVSGNLKRGIIIIIIGSVTQISAGYVDSLSHDVYGIDGLLSWSHQPLEFGLVLSALGGFLILTELKGDGYKKLRTVSIFALIFSLCWIGFNLSLLVGSTILCLPIYEIFSSGCAIL